jgi:hypothetical protein
VAGKENDLDDGDKNREASAQPNTPLIGWMRGKLPTVQNFGSQAPKCRFTTMWAPLVGTIGAGTSTLMAT